ncbi:hypothetical protein GCM10022243_41180 [Saccharothrix violaceirubra]|uniref:Flagellar motor switch protein FliN/FliY n=1 Tax=Saccharothrix violaceirubra TaxID=413306 RepID=A0A7W7WYB9_9PSEU|nr:flagellar motor switch protein FliN [Saccharothrix violaceirubra]MBB4968374.1 flagellar motor switch protein FliN/FliY [Saccharothrix violaceirubra]
MTSATTNPALPTTVRAAAEAALSVLPVGENVTVGLPDQNPMAVARIAGAAVTAPMTGMLAGSLVVVVNQDLVDALRAGPLGELDLVAAVAPALGAAAGALGAAAGPAREVSVAEAVELLQNGGTPVVVPLDAAGAPYAAVAVSVASARTAPAPAAAPVRTASLASGLHLLHSVEMEVTVELGRTRMAVRELLSLTTGSVIELDRLAGSPADLLVNGKLIARGEVVVVDENFGLRLTEILAPADAAGE